MMPERQGMCVNVLDITYNHNKMKREIKFRAWDKLKGEMIFDGIEYELRLISHVFELTEADRPIIGFTDIDHDRFVIMQFTGRLDDNGKEIYEEDIVAYTHYECHPQNHVITETIIVEWINNGFRPFNYLNEKAIIKVVGNIYENPELINNPQTVER